MALKFTRLSNRSNYIDLQVRAMCSSICTTAETLDGFRNAYHYEIEKYPRINTGYIKDSFELEETKAAVIVWHVNIKGDRDRGICKAEINQAT